MTVLKGGIANAAENPSVFRKQAADIGHQHMTGLLALPLFVLMAYCSILSSFSFDKILFAGFACAGAVLLLLAARLAQFQPRLTAIATLIIYSAGLAGISLFAGAENALVWAMVVALPMEIWLVTRQPRGVFAGGILAAALVVLGIFTAVPAQAMLPAGITTLFLLVYGGALLLRVLAQSAPVKSDRDRGGMADQLAQKLEADADNLIMFLSQDGTFTSVSENAVQQFGVEHNVLQGSALLDRVHVADRVQYLAFLDGVKNQHSVFGQNGKAEIRIRCVDQATDTDGQAKIYYAKFALLGQVENKQSASLIRISARNLAGDQQSQNRLLQQSTVIENLEVSRARLLDTVSHELRTPLNSIIGFSDLLLHDVAGPLHSAKQREYIDLIRKSGNHLLGVVNSILEASRLEAGQYPQVFESFDVRDSVTMCHAMLMPQAETKGVVLCDRIHPSVSEMMADRRAVQQILINLVSNAIKFTDRGGCVTIDVTAEPDRQAYGINPQMTIAVSDTGIGLDAQEIQRLCQPFSQINNVQNRMQEGSGLGLYLVKGLVDLHQGTLDIRSQKGQGTTVTIRLPMRRLVDKAGHATEPATIKARMQHLQELTDKSTDPGLDHGADLGQMLEQVKTTILNLQAQQAESSYDGKTEPQQCETQGKLHAQERKTA